MNAGEMKDKITILEITHTGSAYAFTQTVQTWAKVQRLKTDNLFSSAGIGAKTIKFITRKRDISLANAILWQEKHCFLTDIVKLDENYDEITAVLIEPVTCVERKMDYTALDALNRPVKAETSVTFPGFLIRKNFESTQENPMTVLKFTYILITPKAVALEIGELITIGGQNYTVEIAYTLDEYKNEYEITQKSEA